jgi:hypothetical protein
MAFSGPVAASDLRRLDDAAVARRQTTPIGSFAIATSKFRPPPQRHHGPWQAWQRRPEWPSAWLFSFATDLSATTSPGVLININSARNPAHENATQPFAGGGRPLMWINAPRRQVAD